MQDRVTFSTAALLASACAWAAAYVRCIIVCIFAYFQPIGDFAVMNFNEISNILSQPCLVRIDLIWFALRVAMQLGHGLCQVRNVKVNQIPAHGRLHMIAKTKKRTEWFDRLPSIVGMRSFAYPGRYLYDLVQVIVFQIHNVGSAYGISIGIRQDKRLGVLLGEGDPLKVSRNPIIITTQSPIAVPTSHLHLRKLANAHIFCTSASSVQCNAMHEFVYSYQSFCFHSEI